MSDTEQKDLKAMNAEAEDAGLKPPFGEEFFEEEPKKPEVKSPDATPEDEEDKDGEKKPDEKDNKNPDEQDKPPRRSRAPLNELREKIREGLEKKFDEKYGNEIKELQDKLKSYEKGDLSSKDIAGLKTDISALAKELNIDEAQLEKITALSRKGLQEELYDLKSKVDVYEKERKDLKDQDSLLQEEKAFNDDWKSVVPELQKKFPNASVTQIEKAKEIMEEYAFSEKYQDAELEYIIYKEPEAFEKILFSPKKKTFESTSTHEGDTPESEEENIFDSKNKPSTYADVEKMDKKTKRFEDKQPDTRFSVK